MLIRRSPVWKAIGRLEMERRHEFPADDTSIDALLPTDVDPDYSHYIPDVSVDSEWAAIHLGICTKTLRKLRKMGIIRAFAVPGGPIRKHSWRYLMSDLDEFIRTHRNLKRFWDPNEDYEL